MVSDKEEKVPMNENGVAKETENDKDIGFQSTIWSRREKILIVAIILLAILSIILIIALGVVASQKRAGQTKDKKVENGNKHPISAPFCREDTQLEAPEIPKSAGLYDDLSEEELTAVYDYFLKNSEKTLAEKFVPHEEASADKNSIYLIELQQPPKDEALNYLDGNGKKPKRKARVMALMGGSSEPRVAEYLATLSTDNQVEGVVERKVKGWNYPINYNKRPADAFEYGMMEKAMRNVTDRLYRLLKESYGYTLGYNCTENCLSYTPNSPPGVKSLERKHWVYFTRDVEGLYAHPIGFQVLYNTKVRNDIILMIVIKFKVSS